MRGRVRGLFAAALALAVVPSCEDPTEQVPTGESPRGQGRGTEPIPATPVPIPHGRPTTTEPVAAGPPASPSPVRPSKAVPTDGGLPARDGGAALSRDDHDLAVAVESQGRPLAKCFSPSLTTLPQVTIDFQISVSGRVTRTDVEGADRPLSECIRRTAETIQFPAQGSPRSYRYPIRLRRVDAGPPAPAPGP